MDTHKPHRRALTTERGGVALVVAPALLGLVAVRIWLQCSVYGRYTATDSGEVTVATNVLRAALIVVMAAWLMRRGFLARCKKVLAGASIVSMTAASVLFFVAAEAEIPWLLWVSCAFAAFGVIWGGGMWIEAYERLRVRDFVVYAFVALAISSLCGFCLGLLPETFAHLIAIFMPAVSYVTYRMAQGELTVAGFEETVPRAARERFEWGSFMRLLAGVALYDFALGIARGFPYGASIPLDVPLQALHQLGTAVLCAAVVWFALRRSCPPHPTVLWGVLLIFVSVGVLLIATMSVPWIGMGAALVSIANTFTLGVLWLAAYEVSRRSGMPIWCALGLLWAAHLLPRELGRAAMMVWGPYNASPLLVALAMVVPLAASFVLLLKGDEPLGEKNAGAAGTEPESAALAAGHSFSCYAERRQAADESAMSTVLPSLPVQESSSLVEPQTGFRAGSCVETWAAREAPTMSVPRMTDDPLERALYIAERRYGLTRREVEVAIPLARGLSKAAVGEKLCLSESTVRTHGRNLYAKLGVHSREQLLALLEELNREG